MSGIIVGEKQREIDREREGEFFDSVYRRDYLAPLTSAGSRGRSTRTRVIP